MQILASLVRTPFIHVYNVRVSNKIITQLDYFFGYAI